METYQFEDFFEYSIVRSDRRTLTIAIEVGGKVIVKAPFSLTDQEIEYYLAKKKKWIMGHIPEMTELAEKKTVRKYEDGELFLFRGAEYPLKLRTDVSYHEPVVKLSEEKIFVSGKGLSSEQIQGALLEWYKKQAVILVEQRIYFYASRIGVTPNKITLRDTKSRWGSCSGQRNIMINWRVIMAPPEILDYVVVHELCHLKEMNHSRRFWEQVEKVVPDWRKCREWLRYNGISLTT